MLVRACVKKSDVNSLAVIQSRLFFERFELLPEGV